MKFEVITLFPELIASAVEPGVLGQAIKRGQISVGTCNPRDFSKDRHRSVDDRPFGGGDGMIMLAEPLSKSIAYCQERLSSSALTLNPEMDEQLSQKEPSSKTSSEGPSRNENQSLAAAQRSKVIYLSPQGAPLTDSLVNQLATESSLILLCGRYGGLDQRLINKLIDQEVSLGDFVLSGGEIAALALIDAVARKIPGVLGHEESSSKDSFSSGLLEEPQYTRPREELGQEVPSILLGGDHKKIEEYRLKVSLLTTLQKRPDLFQKNAGAILHKYQWTPETLYDFVQALSEQERVVLGLKQDWPELGSKRPPQLKPRTPATLSKHDQEKPAGDGVQFAIALIHYPTLDKLKKVIATNITNFDIHDISRVARTYGVKKYFLVHPMQEQLMFVERVADHWRTGYGSRYNPSRGRALEPVTTSPSLEDAIKQWDLYLKDQGCPELTVQDRLFQGETGAKTGLQRSLLITTSARRVEGVPASNFSELRERILERKTPCLLLFGTGYGMTEELVQGTDALLQPVQGVLNTQFNHLSVRSAVSICLDRLLGS